MTKYYYKMKDCFDNCEDNDIPYISGGYNNIHHVNGKTKKELSEYLNLNLSINEIFSDKWQIKRAESTILTAEEIEHKLYCLETMTPDRNYAIECAKRGDKNGQLKEWQRPEQVELRKEVEWVIKNYPNRYGDLQKAFKNLEPPDNSLN